MGDKSAPCVSWGTHPRCLLGKGFVQIHRQNRLFLRPSVPAPRVRVMPLLRDFRNVTQLMTRTSLPHKSHQPWFSLHASGGGNPVRVMARAISTAIGGVGWC